MVFITPDGGTRISLIACSWKTTWSLFCQMLALLRSIIVHNFITLFFHNYSQRPNKERFLLNFDIRELNVNISDCQKGERKRFQIIITLYYSRITTGSCIFSLTLTIDYIPKLIHGYPLSIFSELN